MDVSSSAECIATKDVFRAYYPTFDFKGEDQDAAYPKGCYVYDNEPEYSGIWYNTQSSGTANKFSRPICKQVAGNKSNNITNLSAMFFSGVQAQLSILFLYLIEISIQPECVMS